MDVIWSGRNQDQNATFSGPVSASISRASIGVAGSHSISRNFPTVRDRITRPSVLFERGRRLWGVLERDLSIGEYVTGDEFCIADMAIYPWARASHEMLGIDWCEHPNCKRWIELVRIRPSCQKALELMEAI